MCVLGGCSFLRRYVKTDARNQRLLDVSIGGFGNERSGSPKRPTFPSCCTGIEDSAPKNWA